MDDDEGRCDSGSSSSGSRGCIGRGRAIGRGAYGKTDMTMRGRGKQG